MTDEINISPDGTVQIIFEMQNGDVVYRDALYFTGDEYSSLTESDVDNLKNARFDAWIMATAPVNSN